MKQRHIFIIDDEPSVRELLEAYFKKQGFLTSSASNFADATKALSETVPDLVILDVLLADADGMDVLSSLKNTHPQLPIIIMTGIGFDTTLLNEAKRRGASGYVSKTMPLQELLAEVNNLIATFP